MRDLVFERYKETLRAGHVAMLRGQLDEALARYETAVELAPHRALPHLSVASVLLGLGRPDEALDAFERAIEREPDNVAARSGRAEALDALGRGDEAAAMRVELGVPAAEPANEAAADDGPTDTAGAAAAAAGAEAADAEAAAAAVGADAEAPGAEAEAPGAEAADAADAAAADADAEAGAPEPVEVPAPPPTDGEQLLWDARAARGRAGSAVELAGYAEAAAAFALAHRSDAALDACQRALSIAPGAPAIHLVLARLYFERGWRDRAIEKLLLLERLMDVEPHEDARAGLVELAREHGADESRLAHIVTASAGASSHEPDGDVVPPA
jgi:tetratricopeptide (TPR) repeat protein